MKKSSLAGAIAALALFSTSMVAAQAEHNYMPPEGYVPDKATAVRVAEAILSPIYGQKQIESERPFIAELQGDIWQVAGSLPRGNQGSVVIQGGVAAIWINKRDGRITRVTHER